MDYGDPVPWEVVDKVRQVVITDFSLPKGDMQRIMANTALIWIDHHKSSIETLKELEDTPGKRVVDKAGCVLTWEFFFPALPIPKAVVYIGDRDIWRHDHSETKPFGEALFHEDTSPENDQLWEPLLEDDRALLEQMIAHGNDLYQARLFSIERLIEKYGFETEFEGHKALALNRRGSGELGEAIRRRGYTIGYCYVEAEQNGDLMTFVTLYSDQIDVSKIAQKFGGGGHAGAAGFSFMRQGSPFPQSATVKKINQNI
jgi:oligoribonuclease NrnB/cAMP/cGMP phosphodiesterase (DHH superfamily)